MGSNSESHESLMRLINADVYKPSINAKAKIIGKKKFPDFQFGIINFLTKEIIEKILNS